MLRWEWFRIYFESGLVKLMSGDVHWRNFTAMDDVLPERSAARVARMVRAALSALVSTRRRSRSRSSSSCSIVWARVPAAPRAHRVLRRRHGAPDRDHRDGELRVPELSRARCSACCCSTIEAIAWIPRAHVALTCAATRPRADERAGARARRRQRAIARHRAIGGVRAGLDLLRDDLGVSRAAAPEHSRRCRSGRSRRSGSRTRTGCSRR